MKDEMYNQLLQDPSLPASKPTQSYWQLPPNERLFGIQSSTLPSQRDVIIIGSGITACSVSRELLNSGFSGSVSVLEAREVCSGATGRNGGRINCVAVLDFDKYTQLFGVETAKRIVRFELAHLDDVLGAAKELGPELFAKSEVRRVDTIAAVFDDEKLEQLKTMLANFEAAFPDLPGQWLVIGEEVREKYGMNEAKGALIGRAGAAWPYRLITSLFERLLDQYQERFGIEANTPALSITRDQQNEYPYTVKTPRGNIQARHVVHCTDGHVSHLVPELRGILVPSRGQMSVQNPRKAFTSTGQQSWSFYFKDGFDYLIQNQHTGEIFIGGGELGGIDNALDTNGIASDAEEYPAAKAHLASILPIVFGQNWGEQQPGKPLMKASWVGIMCDSLDHVPMVGMLPQEALGARPVGDVQKGAEWVSAGYGGYGMVNAWLCGKAVAQQLAGKGVPDWLPKEYQATPERLTRLRVELDNIAGTEKHLRALF
ncbi:hypothetical protein AK830_g2609 [Neonectria ditissima]|uniref:FAD dependent oxidoreductase domain-containing protein n=1 Tax=Neonectria ditissima TaxID=78410 RepID=A0A0P7BRQ9_9HYPO|nr:hypothetical protein AK830_g2609 [Neonectria ditissima]